MTRQHSYDEYSLGNGYAYSNICRYIFRNTLHYSLPICIRIGYIWEKITLFFLFLNFFARFSKNHDLSIPGCVACVAATGAKKFSLSSFSTFLKGWISLIFFRKWDYISLMQWNFFKRERWLFIVRWLTGIVDMIPPILLQRCKFYRSCNMSLNAVNGLAQFLTEFSNYAKAEMGLFTSSAT